MLNKYTMLYTLARLEDILRSEHSKHLNKSQKLLRELLVDREKENLGRSLYWNCIMSLISMVWMWMAQRRCYFQGLKV